MDARRREATPIELSALLMDAACVPAPREEEALAELALHLGVDLERLRAELMFLRAFAVDFAVGLTLGQVPEREAILERYYQHWEHVDSQVGGVFADLQARLELYAEAVTAPERHAQGLAGLVGRSFSHCCGIEDQDEGELAVLGGRMFAALFEEVADLLQNVDIVLWDPRDDEQWGGR